MNGHSELLMEIKLNDGALCTIAPCTLLSLEVNCGEQSRNLKGHCHEKSVSKISIWGMGYLRPSVCAPTAFENVLYVPFKPKFLEKFTFTILYK
jgi:hypothetical protein